MFDVFKLEAWGVKLQALYMTLPETLYTGAQVRALDRVAVEEHGIPAEVLMERAGAAAFALLRARWPRARRPAIVCGGGNNGGDGYVVARKAAEAGLAPVVLQVAAPPTHGAAAMRAACERAGIGIGPFAAARLTGCDAIVDAILGTGLEREVRDEMRAAIEAINAAKLPTLAIDVPSGLHADTGAVLGSAVRAHATISFIGLKSGLYTGEGREHSGAIFFDDLGVPLAVYRDARPTARRITEDSLQGLVRRRPRHAHKGDYGHVLVIGGDRGMPGAPRLAGEAAYRAGAGLVTVATHPDHAAAIASARPELLVHGVREAMELRSLFERASVLALGPGLGQGAWSQTLFGAAIEARAPLVVDADALNLLALDPTTRNDWILTPHPKEAARLLATDVHTVQANRFAAVRALCDRYGGVCVLKGSGTLIAGTATAAVALCDRGNPGMASGGTGDVLTGVIAALLAQGLAPFDAARLGVWLHAVAGDDAVAAAGEIGLMAGDLPPLVRARLNRLAADVGA